MKNISFYSKTWQLTFKTRYRNICLFEEFLEFIADSVSFSNHESSTVGIDPKDIWQVDAYFEGEPDFQKILLHINKIAAQNKVNINDLDYFKVEDQDWVKLVQEKFKPFTIGRFFISSSMYKDECPESKTPIIIEAARAFGTGEHQTTKSCIELLEKLSNKNFHNILDMGSGTGILSIAAAKIWPNSSVLGIDIEEVAVQTAIQNAYINNNKHIQFFSGNGYNTAKLKNRKFDLIISNILASPLINFAPNISSHILHGGYIILSGFLERQAQEVIQAHKKHGFTVVDTISLDHWKTVTMVKDR